eukprot:8568472-Prorocentrum_lima.AAC.1
MPNVYFTAWPTSNPSSQEVCKSCENCQDQNSYSYYEDMRPDTDTESEREEDIEDIENTIEYPTL